MKARGGSSYDNRLRTATEQNVFTNIQFISKKGKLKKCFRHATSHVCGCRQVVTTDTKRRRDARHKLRRC